MGFYVDFVENYDKMVCSWFNRVYKWLVNLYGVWVLFLFYMELIDYV